MTHTILIVDDEATQRAILEHMLTHKLGYQTLSVSGGQEAIDYIMSAKQPQPDLVLLDLSMPRVSGIAVIQSVHPHCKELPIIVLTAHGSFETAVEAVRAGAVDFLAKPADPDRLAISIANALRLRELNNEVLRLRRNAGGKTQFSDMIGTHRLMQEAMSQGRKAANSDIPTLITGEAGVGKEMLARAIHGASSRAAKPFITVKCSAYPEGELEPLLFGRRAGAAGSAIQGKVREAEGGTLFLDHVGMLKPALQVKLLKLLQDHIVEPSGSRESSPVDVRVIASAPQPLDEAVERGEFRQDLYYLLQSFAIPMPSLRDRHEDIPLLLEHHLRRFAVLEDKAVHGISSDVMNELQRYAWPGNVRQLENAVFRAVALSDGPVLSRADFDSILIPRDSVSGLPRLGELGVSPRISQGSLTVTDGNGNVRRMIDLEIDMIKFALRYYDGHMSEVARRLGIGRSTLYRKINDFGIAAPHG